MITKRELQGKHECTRRQAVEFHKLGDVEEKDFGNALQKIKDSWPKGTRVNLGKDTK
jgi:hypothetical protein